MSYALRKNSTRTLWVTWWEVDISGLEMVSHGQTVHIKYVAFTEALRDV